VLDRFASQTDRGNKTGRNQQSQLFGLCSRSPGQQDSLAQNYSGGAMGNQGRNVASGEVNPKQLDVLKATLRGQLLGPGDDGYEAARRIHNG
jgi:hypothetical protein